MKYECHVTVKYIPPDSDQYPTLNETAEQFGFKLAKLYKSKTEKSDLDTFMTSHSDSFLGIKQRMTVLVNRLDLLHFEVTRYKIEEILLDSRNGDSI